MHLFKAILISSLMFGISFTSTTYATDIPKLGIAKQEAGSTAKKATKVVNINIADIETLRTLKGIGIKKAKEIIDYRSKNGPFKKIDDLKVIKGFTDKFISKLQKDNPGLIEVSSKAV